MSGKLKPMNKLELKTEGDTHVIVKRRFAAPPPAVYRAHTDPKLVQRWMLGPEGWTMPVCQCDARVGGRIRYEWSNGKGMSFYLTGEFLALEPFSRIVHVERMHLPEQTPDNHVETRFDSDGTGTLMTMTMTLPDEATRAAMLATGMEHGMEASYVRLDHLTKAAPTSVRTRVHVSMDVPDLEEGLRFYRDVFGFIEKARPFPTMAVLDANNVSVCMHEKPSGTTPTPSSATTRDYERHWTPVHLDLHVEDFDAVLAKVRVAGGSVEAEFRNQGPKPVGFCTDPFGNGFCVLGEVAAKA